MHPAPRISRLWSITGPVLGVLILAIVATGILPVPYVALSPGGARAIDPLIEISSPPGGPAVTEDEGDENLLYVTVASAVEPSGFSLLYRWLGDGEITPSAPFLGTQSGDENRRFNLTLMTDSQDRARKVALERLGFEIETEPLGAFIEDVQPDYPAASLVRPGMTVVSAGGQPVAVTDDLVEQIVAREPGDSLDLEVIPLGESDAQEVRVVLGARADGSGTAALGVSLGDRVSYRFPVDIAIDSGRVGGPSAGLAFTLAILDRMTPGSLTGGNRVAVTGTIDLDGRVGPVGGVRHKAEAAIREGATLFLVPTQEYERGLEAAGGRIAVVGVDDLDDALDALRSIGGVELPDVS